MTACYTGSGGSAEDDADAGEEDAGEGSGESDGGDDGAELTCDEIGAQPLRRVSHVQYEQILRDALPPGFRAAALAVNNFPRTDIETGFSTFATANTVNTTESIMIEDNAEAIAQAFYEGRAELAPELVPCLSVGYAPSDIDGCIDGFIDEFGARLFRRPLTDGERTIMRELYDGIAADDGPELGLTAVVHYYLQAPALLYVTEQNGAAGESYAQLAPHEIATRLALLTTNGLPDAELLAAVDEGRLSTREEVEEHARRLVGSPQTVRAFAHFHHEWMQGFDLDTADKQHPLWDDAIQAALADQLLQFGTWFFDETDGSFETLLTATDFPVAPALAPLYADDPGARPGLLATAATMAAHAHGNATSLIERASFIRDHVVCIPRPPFPEGVDIEGTLEGYGELPTARQRLEPLMTEPACSGCHSTLNPIGFPFEVYDWAGAYRTQENGTDIDTSSDLVLGSIAGNFADAGELIAAIAASQEARDCYATHWFRYAVGRSETLEDQCTLDAIKTAFTESGGDVRELIVQIAISDAFMFRRVGDE